MRQLAVILILTLLTYGHNHLEAGELNSVYSVAPSGGGMTMTDSDGEAWGFPQAVADDFALPQDALITHVRWWGVYGSSDEPNPPPSNFTVRFFANGGSVPGGLLFDSGLVGGAARTPSGRTVTNSWGSFTEYEFLLELSTPVSLMQNQTYWFSVFDNTPTPPFQSDTDFFQTKSDSLSSWVFTHDAGGASGWTVVSENTALAFELLVPEPATLSLIILGGLLVTSRRR